jgi:uncharacterized protein (TIGR02231 family)
MNRYFYSGIGLILFATLMIFHNAWALPVEIEPKIKNVVVFTQSAMIKKEVRLQVKKGENIARISGLTPSLVDQSVQVGIEGKSAVRISEINVAATNLKKAPQEKMLKLQAKLNDINEQIKAGTNEISVITSANDFLKKVMPFSQNQKVSQSEVEDHAKFLEKTLAGNYDRIAGIEAIIKKLQEEKITIENEIKDLNPSDKSKSIEFYLISPDDNKEITLAFSYIVNNAGWDPLYEVRADSEASHINMNYFATITQSTGEDWTDVDVEISTAMPLDSEAPAELTAWNVDVYQPRALSRLSSMMREETTMPKSAMEEDAPEVDETKPFEETQVQPETTSFSFIIPRKVSIPSDSQPHRVMIASSKKEAVFSYYAIPKLSKYAYLRADFKNPFAFPLLPGRINIFLDGRLVSTSSSEGTIPPEEDINLSLGIDEAIKIERKLQKKFTEYAGVISKDTKVNYEYASEFVNAKEKAVTITVNDNFPVSRNEKIKVDLLAPKKEEVEISDEGVITWKLKLAPGEKKDLALRFRVEYSKELNITGLE